MKKIWQKASCRKTIKKIAFEDPKGTLAWAVLILFVIMGFLSSALRLALGHLGYDFEITLINSLLTVLLMVVIAPLTLGLMNMFLKNSRDEIYTLSDLFGQIKKSPKYLLVFGLLMIGYTLIQWLVGLIPLVGPIINIILFILFMPVYFIFPLVYLEHSNLNLKETIIKAFDIVSGRRIQFYAMLCSFAGWFLLGIITLGLLFIWVIPYLYIALTYLYLYWVHEKEFDRPKSLGDGWLIIITILALGLFEVALIVNIPQSLDYMKNLILGENSSQKSDSSLSYGAVSVNFEAPKGYTLSSKTPATKTYINNDSGNILQYSIYLSTDSDSLEMDKEIVKEMEASSEYKNVEASEFSLKIKGKQIKGYEYMAEKNNGEQSQTMIAYYPLDDFTVTISLYNNHGQELSKDSLKEFITITK